MTMKSLLLGAAAGLTTVGAAQAADLPMTKAEPVEYVKVCTEFGEGYFYIPGTDTCLRLQGEIRAFYRAFDPKNGPNPAKHDNDGYNFSTQARVMWDARTQTEWGLLRSYFQINATADNGAFKFEIDKAFLQLGGFTAGFAHSFFGIYDNDYGNTIFAGYFTSQSTVNLLAYTATFGGGFSATLAVEDGGEHQSVLWEDVNNAVVGYGGKRVPDFVGQLRIDQGWGEAAVFAASHQVTYPTVAGFPTEGSDWGWAAGAGVGVKLPFLAGAHLALEGVYADGAANYLGLSGGAADASFFSGLGTDLGHGWSITGELGVDVTPALSLTAFGSYVDYTAGEAGGVIDSTWEDDFKAYVVGANAIYTVVKGLTVGAEVFYTKTEFKNFGDTSAWQGGVRIRRTF